MSVLDIAQSDEQIDLLAELGIAVLLFLVGLKLDFNLVRTLGPVALVTGLGQVVFTTVFGFLIALALGLSATTAIYVAIALTFSSTIIIVKLLSGKREIDALHGRIALGFLIVQDIVVVVVVVVVAMIALSAITSASARSSVDFWPVSRSHRPPSARRSRHGSPSCAISCSCSSSSRSARRWTFRCWGPASVRPSCCRCSS